MKKSKHFSIFIIGFLLIHSISFAQANADKEWAIKFSGYETKLSNDVTETLDSIAILMKAHSHMYYAVNSYCLSCGNSRYNQVRWDRVNNIIVYLVEKKGISCERLAGRPCIDGGDCDTVEFSVTSERPNSVAPPHPNLRKGQ